MLKDKPHLCRVRPSHVPSQVESGIVNLFIFKASSR